MSFRTEIEKLLGRRAGMGTRLIVINIIVFILANVFNEIFKAAGYGEDYASGFFALPSSLTMLLHRPWTLITYMFLHVQIMHLVWNMLWFYWFSIIFTDFMSNKRLLYTYLFGGICGGILFILFSNLFMPGSYLLGASAGIMAVIVATAFLVPDYELHLIFFGAVKIKYLAIGAFILTSLVDFSVNSGGKVSHIGGALYGMLYIYQVRRGRDYAEIASNFFNKFGRFLTFKRRSKLKKTAGGGVRQQKSNVTEKQKKIDTILDKISSSGYDALTKEEKDFLFKSSKDS